MRSEDMSTPDGFELTSRPNERRLVTGKEVWCVYELMNGDAARACLVFESVNIVRRVRTYPSNWRELPDSALMLLKEQK
jgi:hypothetical protein